MHNQGLTSARASLARLKLASVRDWSWLDRQASPGPEADPLEGLLSGVQDVGRQGYDWLSSLYDEHFQPQPQPQHEQYGTPAQPQPRRLLPQIRPQNRPQLSQPAQAPARQPQPHGGSMRRTVNDAMTGWLSRRVGEAAGTFHDRYFARGVGK